MKNKNIFHFIGKLIIRQDDKEILDKINLNRNVIEDGLVWEAWKMLTRFSPLMLGLDEK